MSAPSLNDAKLLSAEAELRAEIQRLRRTNSELDRKNQELERFTFAASHDLREPLRMITTYAQLLTDRCGGALDNDASLYVRTITDGATRMSELLADLLAYAELGHPLEECGPVDLNSILETVLRDLKTSIDDAEAVVTSERLPVVQGHASDVLPLLQNLVANAIKYRSERPLCVEVSARLDGSELIFAVKDNGIGVEPRYHAEIFEPFKRLHGKSIPGTGLGLSICKRIVERYEGRIWVESQPDAGATFFVALRQNIAMVAR